MDEKMVGCSNKIALAGSLKQSNSFRSTRNLWKYGVRLKQKTHHDQGAHFFSYNSYYSMGLYISNFLLAMVRTMYG
jgi:hypothetical protein